MNEIVEVIKIVPLIDKFLLIIIFVGIYFGKEWIDKKRNKKCGTVNGCSNEHCPDHKNLAKDVSKVKDGVGEIKIDCAETKTNIEWIKNKICN